MLGNVNTLNLARTKVVNVKMLGNVYKLKLSGTEVSNVSMLKMSSIEFGWMSQC
jgi:hypothetical protein